MNIHFKSDERILGDTDFTEHVLKAANESLDRKSELRIKGFDLDKCANRVAQIYSIEVDKIFKPGKQPTEVKARSLFSYWAVRELGYTLAQLAPQLGITQPAVSICTQRGERIAFENGYQLYEE